MRGSFREFFAMTPKATYKPDATLWSLEPQACGIVSYIQQFELNETELVAAYGPQREKQIASRDESV